MKPARKLDDPRPLRWHQFSFQTLLDASCNKNQGHRFLCFLDRFYFNRRTFGGPPG